MEHQRQPKPPRLRSACNQCNAAKVKCTGEREGCARCKNLEADCTYIESRVGKVQGPRAKRKRSEPQQSRELSDAEIEPSGRAESVDRTVTVATFQQPTSPRKHGETPRSAQQHQQHPNFPWSESQQWESNDNWSYEVPLLDGSLPDFDEMLEDNSAAAATDFDELTNVDLDQTTTDGSVDFRGYSCSNLPGPDASLSISGNRRSKIDSTVHMPHASLASSNGATQRVRQPAHPGQAGANQRLLGCNSHLPLSGKGNGSPHSTRRALSVSNGGTSRASIPSTASIAALPTPQSGSSDVGRTVPCPTQSPTPRPDRPRQDSSLIDSKCVLACVRVLATLENYLLGELKNLDLIMEAIHKAGIEVRRLVQLQQRSRCDRCLILFNAIVFQMIELLEAGARPLPEPDFGDDASFPDGSGGVLFSLDRHYPHASRFSGLNFGFGFGPYSPTDDEQKAWRSRILRRECQHVAIVLSSVIGLIKLGPPGVHLSPQAIEERAKCMVDLERKLEDLYEKQGGRGSVMENSHEAQ